MRFTFPPEPIALSVCLLLVTALALFWTRSRVQIPTEGRLQLAVACVPGLAYGLFRVWVGCGLVMPPVFK